MEFQKIQSVYHLQFSLFLNIQVKNKKLKMCATESPKQYVNTINDRRHCAKNTNKYSALYDCSKFWENGISDRFLAVRIFRCDIQYL